LSSGDVIGIINSDDQYLPGVLRKVVDLYAETKLDFIVHGNMIRERQGERKRIRPRPFPHIWKYVDCPFDHPTLFVPRKIYDRVGLFNTGYRYAMDYDFYLRALRSGIEFRYLSEDIALFSAEGKSGQRPRECHREVLRSQGENGLFMPLCYMTFSLKMGVNRLKSLF
jgi:glycosyltransferase